MRVAAACLALACAGALQLVPQSDAGDTLYFR